MKSQSVNGLVFSPDQRSILIVKRRDVPIWVIPGGAVDPFETPEDAVIREIFEETGCTVAISQKIAVYHPLNRLSNTTHLYLCSLVSGTPQTGNETKEIGFFDLEHLPHNFFHIHREMIEDALKRRGEIIERPLQSITYLSFFKYCLAHPVRVTRFLLSKLGFPLNT